VFYVCLFLIIIAIVSTQDLPWLAINPTEARKWFRLASNMWKNPEAMHELGSMLWRGEGSLPLAGQQDAAGAVALWQAAASAGHQEAQTALGDIEKALQEIITNASRGQVWFLCCGLHMYTSSLPSSWL
jgi:hypothetical protein